MSLIICWFPVNYDLAWLINVAILSMRPKPVACQQGKHPNDKETGNVRPDFFTQ